MTVIIVQRVTPALRGTLTRWMLEVAAGIFVGTLSSRVREKLWEHVQGRRRLGACVLIARAPREQGFVIQCAGDSARTVRDYDGLALVARAHPARPIGPGPVPDATQMQQIALAAGVDRRTVESHFAGGNVRPRAAKRIQVAWAKLTR